MTFNSVPFEKEIFEKLVKKEQLSAYNHFGFGNVWIFNGRENI